MGTSRRNSLKGTVFAGIGALLSGSLPEAEIERVVALLLEGDEPQEPPRIYAAAPFSHNPSGTVVGNQSDLFFDTETERIYVCRGGVIWKRV